MKGWEGDAEVSYVSTISFSEKDIETMLSTCFTAEERDIIERILAWMFESTGVEL